MGRADFVATAEIEVAAPATQVWKALTDPEIIAKYFFGSRVETSWQPGSPIRWKGEWQGRPYEDKGYVLDVKPNRQLKVSHFSPLSGAPDKPENYHTVTYELEEHGSSTRVTLIQDNNKDETEAEHSRANWRAMLAGLKKTVEDNAASGDRELGV